MAELKIELNSSGIQDFLKSNEMQDMLRERAEAIQRRCGDGYDVTVKVGRTRAAASVVTGSQDAKTETYSNNTLLKACK